MQKPQLTIRMTLLIIVGVLNLLIAILVGHRVYKSWQHYQQVQLLKAGSQVINSLYAANKNLSLTRASTLSLMYSPPSVAESLYQDLLKNRKAVDASLSSAFGAMVEKKALDANKLSVKMKDKYQILLERRSEIDAAFRLPLAERNPFTTNKFFEENTALIVEIQNFILIYSRSYQEIDATISRHMIFEYFVWELAEYSGEEYAIIGQMIAENKYPTQLQREQLLSLRGRIEYGWDILRKFALNEALAEKLFPLMEQASAQYFFAFDQVSELFYGNYALGGKASYPISSAAWLGMSTQTVDSLLILQNEILVATKNHVDQIELDAKREITISGLIFLCAVIISLYCLSIIIFRVARPINAMVSALYNATNNNFVELPTFYNKHDEIGKLAHVLDIFQRNTQKMKQSNEELERFAFIAAHDLKSPLRALDNISQWLEEDLDEILPDASRKHLDEMRTRVRLMDKMLDDTLEYARLNAKIDSQPNDVVSGRELVDEIVALLDLPAGFVVRIGNNLANLRIQKLPLQQVLFNLVNNAVKHHDKPVGLIEVDVTENVKEFVFFVSDDGPGIEPQYHQKIFDMFQTLQRRDKTKGRGMGLAMVRKIVTANGGAITVESSLGKGAIFRFTWLK